MRNPSEPAAPQSIERCYIKSCSSQEVRTSLQQGCLCGLCPSPALPEGHIPCLCVKTLLRWPGSPSTMNARSLSTCPSEQGSHCRDEFECGFITPQASERNHCRKQNDPSLSSLKRPRRALQPVMERERLGFFTVTVLRQGLFQPRLTSNSQGS